MDNLNKILNYAWQIPILHNVSLKSFTTFRCSAYAKYIVTLSDQNEFSHFLHLQKSVNIPFLILGKGSNLIFTDYGYDGFIIQLKGKFRELILSANLLSVGSGVLDREIARIAKKNQLCNAEFLATIPGTIGGGVYMNAGAHCYELKDIVKSVSCIDIQGTIIKLTNEQCAFGYRKSIFQSQKLYICQVELELEKCETDFIEQREAEMLHIRKTNQPIHAATWGSVFVNPNDTLSAGKLIELCGLKGEGFGQVRISTKHANFIENLGGANYTDVIKTINLAKDAVFNQFNINLKLEVLIIDNQGNFINFDTIEPTITEK